MNQEIKARWVAALRSGEYKQGTNVLHRRSESGDTFCCLGVLCDLAAKDGVALGDNDPYFVHYDDAWTTLPAVVQEWAGLPDLNPDIEDASGEASSLAGENDTGATFNEIADLIEAQL